MKRMTLFLMTGMCMATATAQNVTYNHDSAKQNQFTVAEIGSGSFTPDLYYTLLHNGYRKTASAKIKLSFRTTTGIAEYWQVDDAEKLDSSMTRRAEIEALNVADRTGGALDVAWLAEGDKLNSKMADFKKNINRIPRPAGGVEGILQCVQVDHQSDTGSVYAQLAAQEAVPEHLCRRVAQKRGIGALSRLSGQQQDDRLTVGIKL